ncbi:MAG: LysE family transporter [Lachnospiraceae bacterium]|nr:LysE family transporter [Lachnospiraceae bacterium]
MIVEYFFKGLLIALVFGVPAGAIGALTIRRTLEKGFLAGLVTGAGSSAADLFYSCVGVFGITIISDFLTEQQVIIRIIGGTLILVLGIAILRKKELSVVPQDSKGTLVYYFLSAFTTAILNPATVLSFMVAFAAFGIGGGLAAGQGLALISGILTGTLCWWSALSGVAAYFRKKVTDYIYKWLNRILGCFMLLFGFVMIMLAACGSADTERTPTDMEVTKMNVQIGEVFFTATLEDNAAVHEFIEMMEDGPVSINMSDYSGFEKVGPLGKSLTADNHKTTTSAGDIVLYNGNQIVMFYGSNSWSYTRIGRIDDLSGWEEALGSGSITAVFSLSTDME